MYADVTVIVDGAVGTEDTFYDYALMEQFIDTIRDEAMGDGYPTDVYIQYHEHDMTDNECICAQYETDHHPTTHGIMTDREQDSRRRDYNEAIYRAPDRRPQSYRQVMTRSDSR